MYKINNNLKGFIINKQFIIAALLSTAYCANIMSMLNNNPQETDANVISTNQIPQSSNKDSVSIVELLKLKQQMLNDLSSNLNQCLSDNELKFRLEWLIRDEYKSLFKHLNFILGHKNNFLEKYCGKDEDSDEE